VCYNAATHLFLKHSFNMRGLIASNRPHYIPGGMSVMGSRVPDMIFSHADKPIFMQLLKQWDLLHESDARRFVQRLMHNVRQCFHTHRLQDLHSDTHTQFDLASDGITELAGIRTSMRKGTDCSTNCSAALVLLGDCREHTIEMLAFFDFWQSELLNRVLRPGLDPNASDDLTSTRQMLGSFSEELDDVLRIQMRGAHVGVYAAVQMDSKYNPTAYSSSSDFVPRLRSYTLADLRSGVPLSTYELQNSLIVVSYTDGSVRVLEPQWNAATSYWGIDSRDGVPTIPDAASCESIQLLNLIEEHTMTFLCEEGRSLAEDSFLTMSTAADIADHSQLPTANFKVELADAFYNSSFDTADIRSPYSLGSGEIDLNDLLRYGTLSGGTMKAGVFDDNGQCVQLLDLPVRLRLLNFSCRSDVPAVGDDDCGLRLIGVNLANVDVVAELVRERHAMARQQPTRRDQLLRNMELLARHLRDDKNKQQHQEQPEQQ
jgi:hypothetical protein